MIIKKIIKDLGKACLIGMAVGAALAILFFVGGFLFGGFTILNGLEVMKDGLLLLSSIGLFLVAGMILTKGKKQNIEEKKEAKNGWREHFSVIGLKTVAAMICLVFILLASVADYLLMCM